MKPDLVPLENEENIAYLDIVVFEPEPNHGRMALGALDSLELQIDELRAESLRVSAL